VSARNKPRWLASVATSILFAASVARAEGAPRIAALGSGPDGDAIASAMATRAASEPPDSDAFRGALGAGGLRVLGVASRKREKSAELVARARAAARAAHVDKVVLVHVEKGRGKGVVHVWVVDAQGSGGALIDQDVRVSPGAGVDEETDAAWSTAQSAFPAPVEATPAPTAAATPPAPAPEPATSVAIDPTERPPTADTGPVASAPPHGHDHTRAGALAVLRASVEGGSRHFSYVDRLTPTLRPYDLFAAPLLALEGELYPLATSSIPVLSGLGVTANYARAFGLSSQDSGGAKVGTSWQAFDLGLRERIPIGGSFILGVDAGYGDTSFAFDDAIQASAQLPSVHYKVLRGGLDGRVGHGDLSLHAGASYLHVLSTGDFAALFPRATVGGIEASLGIADAVATGVELSLEVAYTRFFYSLLPVPGDAYVAGGALDKMASISLGVAYLF
jgi:hypothetical protein